MITTTGPIAPSALARPRYLDRIADPDFGTTLVRPVGDSGTPISIGGQWGADSRHGHSARQPWNDDGSMLLLEQRGGTPSSILLDGKTFAVIAANRGTSNNLAILEESGEDRWRPGYPDQLVSVLKLGAAIVTSHMPTGRELSRIVITPPAGLPDAQRKYLGWRGEASISVDGRWTVIGTHREDGGEDFAAVVDLQRGAIGPWYSLAAVNAFRPSSGGGQIGHGDVSVDGRLYWCKLSGTPEVGFVFDIDQDVLTLSPRSLDSSRCVNGEAAAVENSVLALSHASMGIYAGVPVLVGGVRTYSGGTVGEAINADGTFDKGNGRVVAISMLSGHVHHVSPGTIDGVKENSDEHTSARCYKRPGWALVTFARGTNCFAYELVLMNLDGSRQIERVGVTRTYEPAASDGYRAEAHGCPSPDGRRVMFATNWNAFANPLGDPDEAKCLIYDLDAPDDGGDVDPPPPDESGPYVVRPFNADHAIFDKRTGRLVHPTDAIKAMNAAEANP